MKFKMANEQIDEINELLKTHGDSLTAFYDEGIYHGTVKGIIIGALVGVIASNMCWVTKCIKDHKNQKRSSNKGSFFYFCLCEIKNLPYSINFSCSSSVNGSIPNVLCQASTCLT